MIALEPDYKNPYHKIMRNERRESGPETLPTHESILKKKCDLLYSTVPP